MRRKSAETTGTLCLAIQVWLCAPLEAYSVAHFKATDTLKIQLETLLHAIGRAPQIGLSVANCFHRTLSFIHVRSCRCVPNQIIQMFDKRENRVR